MKKVLTATVEEDLLQWIEDEKSKKDAVGRRKYRNKSQLIEDLLILGKKALAEFEREKEKSKKE